MLVHLGLAEEALHFRLVGQVVDHVIEQVHLALEIVAAHVAGARVGAELGQALEEAEDEKLPVGKQDRLRVQRLELPVPGRVQLVIDLGQLPSTPLADDLLRVRRQDGGDGDWPQSGAFAWCCAQRGVTALADVGMGLLRGEVPEGQGDEAGLVSLEQAVKRVHRLAPVELQLAELVGEIRISAVIDRRVL